MKEKTASDTTEMLLGSAIPSKETYGLELGLNTLRDLERIKNNSKDLEPSLSLLSEIWTNLKPEILTRNGTPKHPIGLKELDDLLWGMHKKELTVIAARTSQGKTAFSLYLLKRLAEAYNRAIYFSLEMSKEQILERLLSQVTMINNIDIRKGRANEAILKNEDVFSMWMDKVKILIDDRYGYVFENVIKIVDMIRPDFVFLDYIQMVSARGFKSKLEAVEEFVRKLKELSVEYNFGVIILSQVNREGVGGAEMHHLKWAGILEEHADTVMMLRWEWSIEQPNKYIVDIKKQRHGEVRNGVVLHFDPSHFMFRDWSLVDVPRKDRYIEKE